MDLVTRTIPADHYTARADSPRRDVGLIVMHSAEAPERPKVAESIARYFQGPAAPQASAHFVVDDAEIIQCVRPQDVAWHAPGVNWRSLGIELAGYAFQTRDQWLDAWGQKMLPLAARLVAELCREYGISVRFVPADELNSPYSTATGITTHQQVSAAFPCGNDGHSDPGPNFPTEYFLELVQGELSRLSA
jgi:N-acetyl-anhydromuramyl-L-alanine amidase AmpD